MVDTNLITGLIHQVELRSKMLGIEIKSGDLDYDGDEDQIYADSLYELSKTEPSSIEQQLAEEAELVDQIDKELNKTVSEIDNFKSLILGRMQRI